HARNPLFLCDMRKLLMALLISTGPALAQGSETAYEALRVVGTQLNRDYVNHIISVTGLNGDPQPQVWKILIDDPSARGGVREIEVEHGNVTRVEGMFSGGSRKRIVTQSQEAEDAEDTDEDSDDDGIKARIKRVFRETRDETKRIFHNVRRSFADFIRG